MDDYEYSLTHNLYLNENVFSVVVYFYREIFLEIV